MDRGTSYSIQVLRYGCAIAKYIFLDARLLHRDQSVENIKSRKNILRAFFSAGIPTFLYSDNTGSTTVVWLFYFDLGYYGYGVAVKESWRISFVTVPVRCARSPRSPPRAKE
jgi:hypothetical protein